MRGFTQCWFLFKSTQKYHVFIQFFSSWCCHIEFRLDQDVHACVRYILQWFVKHTHTHKSPFFIILFEYCKAAKKQQQKHVSVNINKTNGTTTEQPRGKKNNPNNPLKIDKMSLQMVWRQNISIFRNKKVYFIWFIDVLDLRKSKFLSIFFRVFLLFFSLHLRCTFILSPKSTNWSPIISKKNSQVIEKHSKTTPITEYIYTKIGYVKKYYCLCRTFLCFMMIIFVCFCAFRWCVLVSHPAYILTYQLTAKKKRKH